MELIPWRNKGRAREGGARAESHPLSNVRNELENMFDRFVREPWGAGLSGLFGAAGFPQLDMIEGDDELTVRAELPGINPDEVKIEISGNTLRLSGEKSAEREERAGSYLYSERQFGSFTRTLQLPTPVDADNVEATYRDGVLNIRLPKRPDAKPKRVQVKTQP